MFRILIIIALPFGLLGLGFLLSLGIVSRMESNYPAHGSFIQVGDVRLHYVEQGAGRPIVMIHGSMLNTRDMEMSLFPALMDEYHVIAFDRPGLGHSTRVSGQGHEDPREQARLIHQALDEMGIAQPVLVGHSWGAAVALAYAMDYPDDVKGVLVLSGATHPYGEQSGIYNMARAPIIGSIMRHSVLPPLLLASASSALQQRFFWPDGMPENYLEQVGLFLVTDPDRFLNDATDFAAIQPALAEMRGGYGAIRTPMIIMTGDQDQAVVAEENSFRLHVAVAGSELIMLDDTGHMPHHTATDDVVRAIVDLAER